MKLNLERYACTLRRGRCLFLLVALVFAGGAAARQRYPVKGLVLEVNKPQKTMTISCESIQGYMEATAMPIEVRDAKELDGLARGMMIEFILVVDKEASYAEGVRIRHFDSLDLDPLSARRLRILDGVMDPSLSPANVLRIGQLVPDFSLTDQNHQHVMLSQFSGKVVVITFVYIRCPFPNYCFRLSNNFGLLQKRFHGLMGGDLMLLSITLDPIHDQPESLAEYGDIWKVDPKGWRLLTGPPSEIQKFGAVFGVSFFPDEGQLIHSLHTLIVDRRGKLAANLEGNEFTASQLGDLIQTVMLNDAPPAVHP